MKNFILGMAFFILAITYMLRVNFVNTTLPLPVTLKYEMGAEVAIEDDFFDSSDENMNGYTVTVLGTELLTIDEFIALYEIEDSSEYDYLEYVYLVTASFRNMSNKYGEMGGINLSKYVLQKSSYITYMDIELYYMVNNVNAYSFSLNPGTKKKLIIPFGIDTAYIDVERINDEFPRLVVTEYPHKKIIELSS